MSSNTLYVGCKEKKDYRSCGYTESCEAFSCFEKEGYGHGYGEGPSCSHDIDFVDGKSKDDI